MSDQIRKIRLGKRVFTCPYADVIRPMTAIERKGMVESIKQYGIKDAIIVDQSDNVLDGMNRLTIAAEMAMNPASVPIQVMEVPSPEDARAFVLSKNRDRRHLTQEELKALREDRRKEVSKLAAEGMSQREIAKEVGASQATIGNDLASTGASEQGCSDTPVEDLIATRRAKVKELIEQGLSQKVVADLLKTTKDVVKNDVAHLRESGELQEPSTSKGKDGKTRKKIVRKKKLRKQMKEEAAKLRKEIEAEEAERRIVSSPDPEKARQDRDSLASILRDVMVVLKPHSRNTKIHSLIANIKKMASSEGITLE